MLVLFSGDRALAEDHEAAYLLLPADLTWAELRPYIRANIVPFGDESGFDVFVCDGRMNRSVADPFSERLADLVQVLVMNQLLTDPEFEDSLSALVDAFRDSYTAVGPAGRPGYRERFWRALEEEPSLTAKLAEQLRLATATGCLRCLTCELAPDYEPIGMQRGCRRPRGEQPPATPSKAKNSP